MSQHAVLYYARSGSDLKNIVDADQDDSLMHAAGLHTHLGTTHLKDQDTVDSLIKEFGDLFDPQTRRRVFEAEFSKLFRSRSTARNSTQDEPKITHVSGQLHSGNNGEYWEFQDGMPCSTARNSTQDEPKITSITQVAPMAFKKPMQQKRCSSVSEKKNSPRRTRKTADVYQAGFN
jgi:hypothetical protein